MLLLCVLVAFFTFGIIVNKNKNSKPHTLPIFTTPIEFFIFIKHSLFIALSKDPRSYPEATSKLGSEKLKQSFDAILNL